MIDKDLENMINMLDNDILKPIRTSQYVLLPKCKDEIITKKNNQNYIKSYFSQGVNPQNVVPTYLEDGIWTDVSKIKQNNFTNSILKVGKKYTEQYNQEMNRYSEITQKNTTLKSCNSSKKCSKRVTFEQEEKFHYYKKEFSIM